MKRLILLFSVSVLLIVQHLEAQTAVTDTVFLQLYNDSVDLKEVVVKGKRTPVANSRWSDMSPVELVTVGGANGDLYQALQTLPGTQVQGESGRLLVRGGSSDETQTYIDGMHVLNPYTATGINSPARGRYSTFMFSGVNLESGGAPLEYGGALSAVPPGRCGPCCRRSGRSTPCWPCPSQRSSAGSSCIPASSPHASRTPVYGGR